MIVRDQNDKLLLPTGTCFEDVTWYFAQLIGERPICRKREYPFFMVHGICINNYNRKYSHAWIEDFGLVHFPCAYQGGAKGFALAERKDFYETFRVQEFTKYHFADLIELAEARQPPPWKSKYRRLCRNIKGAE